MLGRYTWKISLRLAGLIATCVVGTVLVLDGRFVITPFLFGGMAIAQAVGIVHIVERTNRDLARFMGTVRADEFGERFEREREGVGFDELGRELSSLLGRVKALRGQSEVDLRVLKAIVDQVPVALIAVSPDGGVEHLNQAARRFFGTFSVVRVGDLRPLGAELVRAIEALAPGQTQLVSVGQSDRVLLRVSQVHSGAQVRRVFSLQSVRDELESAEVEAWQTLVRVLTHELMNSLTPVRSLTKSAADLLQAGDAEAIEDAKVALQTVAKRADGLLRFIDSYREIARVPQPKRREIQVSTLFDRVRQLFGDEGAQLEVSLQPDSLVIRVDPEQIERVLINLIRNALDAAPAALVRLDARINARGRPEITVTDDGPGVPQAVASKIFVPFFTTKQKGSGVGLSLTQQIMRAHGGFVSFEAVQPHGAQFTLHFRSGG